jgi:hypothetical protein
MGFSKLPYRPDATVHAERSLRVSLLRRLNHRAEERHESARPTRVVSSSG